MKKRWLQQRWLHYHPLGTNVRFLPESNGPSTICGKTGRYRLFRGPAIVKDPNQVTCPRCIEELKKQKWYCPNHGFLKDEDVENDETCTYCGEKV